MHYLHAAKEPDHKLDSITRWLWAVLIGITLWRLWAAWALPVTRDEAYYFDWARSLSWGYFDHPPGVALLGIGTLLAPASVPAGRLGTLLAATLTLLVLIRLYRSCGLRGGELLVALVIACATLPGLVSGFLATPDTALGLAWAISLHEGLAALRGERRRWLGAGIAAGLGLLGKYTMAVMGPVFLWAILWADPKALKTPWPYLGGLLALLVFGPHLLWNAENDWLPVRFQLGHGFSMDAGTLVTSPLPAPIDAPNVPTGQSSGPRSLCENLGSLLSFFGTQIALWGLLAMPVLAGLFWRRGTRSWWGSGTIDEAAKALLVTGCLVPLVFFALVAVFSEVEPNWPAVYLSSAAPLAALAAGRLWKWVMLAAGANLLVASLYVLHGATGLLPLSDGGNRILRETHGYQELAQKVAALPGPLFADRYQIAAMVRFYEPDCQITQWPGMSRPSEYLRGTIAGPVTRAQIKQSGGFRLVSRRYVPPDIPGFRLRSRDPIFDCPGRGLIEAPKSAAELCRDPLHRWEIFDYVAE